MEMIANTSFK